MMSETKIALICYVIFLFVVWAVDFDDVVIFITEFEWLLFIQEIPELVMLLLRRDL